MLKAKVLVVSYLIQSEQMKWVRVTPASDVNLCFRSPSWLGWIKLFEIKWNWSLLPITFLISFPIVLRRIIGLKDLEELYNSLLDFGMIIDVNTLKWDGQWPNSKHTSAMLITLFRHDLSLTIYLRCLQDNLSSPRVDKLLYLVIELVNSSLEKGTHTKGYLFEILSNTPKSIWWSWAILNDK